MDCWCHDGIVCDACASVQIEQSLSLSEEKPVLTEEQVDALVAEVDDWLSTLKPAG